MSNSPFNGHAPNNDLDEQVLLADEAQLHARLGTLSPAQYAKERDALAQELGISVMFLDSEWKERRKAAKRGSSEQETELFPIDKPWDYPVTGAPLFSLIMKRLKRHVVFASDEQAVATVLWIAFAWTHESHTHSPILLATSAEANCGKTTLISLVRFLTPRPLFTAEISPAALYRSIEKWRPTIVLDEADGIFKENDELRAVVNTGWTRGSGIIRCHPETNEPMIFPTFCPKALGMKGKKLPDTTLSRCIILELKRKLPGEQVEGFDHQDSTELQDVRRLLARWAQDSALKGAKPEVPEGFDNRIADNWNPLLAIADLVGGDWPAHARKAAIKLTPLDPASVGTRLLADIRVMFEYRDRLLSGQIVEGLHALEDRPWAEWGKSSKPISKNQLAGLLKEFRVFPDTIRVGDKLSKGYMKVWFEEAWGRYLPSFTPSPLFRTEHRNKADEIRGSDTFQTVTPNPDVTVQKCENPLQDSRCSDVTVENPPSLEKRVCDHCRMPPSLPGAPLQEAHISDRDGPVWLHPACQGPWLAATDGHDGDGQPQEHISPEAPDTDDELLQTLKGLAGSQARISSFSGRVQIDSGPEPEPKRIMPEQRKAKIRRVWPRLSPEQQQQLAKWREENGI